jgi:hypothetical protein
LARKSTSCIIHACPAILNMTPNSTFLEATRLFGGEIREDLANFPVIMAL